MSDRTDRQLDRLDDKLEKVRETIDLIRLDQLIQDGRLDEYNNHLEEHMRRTKALEAQVGIPYIMKLSAGIGTFAGAFITGAYKVAKVLGYL